MKRRISAILFGILALTLLINAQSKPPAKFADFGKWETLSAAGSRGGFSPNGRWLVTAINRSNRENELRIVHLADGTTKIAAFGAQPVFSSDSRWLAYAIVPSETEQDKLRSEQKPVQNKFGLLDLGSGGTATIEGIESFAFSPDGAFLAMRRYAPARQAAPGAGNGAAPRVGPAAGGADADEASGTTLIVRRLADARDMAFGNVSQFAWRDSERAHLLALIISVEGKTGNGVQVLDAETGVLRSLDSSAATYTDIAWRKDAADLAVMRARTDDRKDGPTYSILAWTDLGKNERLRTYDPAADPAFPAGMRTVAFRRLSWTADGKTLFFGLAKWDDRIVPPAKTGKGDGPAVPAEEFAALQIWHWSDVVVQPKQKVDASADRRRNILAAWNLDSGRLTPLGKDAVNEDAVPIRRTNLAYVAEWSKYAMNRTIGRPGSDLYLADITTGIRTKVRDNVIDGYIQAGPAGKYLLFLQGDHYYTVNLATRAVTDITKPAPLPFIDKESDQTVAQKPPYGVAGWTKDDAAVLLYDKYDVWKIASDGSTSERLTNGAAEQVRHRLVRLDYAGGGRRFGGDDGASAVDPGIDLGKPLYFSLYGEWTKKSGFARLLPGGALTRLLWLDKGVGSLAKAKDADVYGYIVQDFDDSPDIFVGGPELKDAKQATATNPFQKDYAWGRGELVDYKGDQGLRLQGALFYPAGYEMGRKYPMIVYMYEKLSQGLHNYVAPSDRSYYNISVFTSLGYFVFEPDIMFTPRQPGVSVVQCVVPGVKKVLESGKIDPRRVGCVGHSWGGFDAAFLAANTQGVFAAAVAGAPLTDLVSMYGDHHWGPGIAETDHIETGQERMEVPLYEDLADYVANSAIFTVPKMTVPLLLEEGDADSVVFWHQSVEMYNIARRALKNVVFLVYEGEDHGLRLKKNQIDYQRRILAWFGHYLKDEPAEAWISKGQSYLDREAEIRRGAVKK
jgi:dipeptidyl aminopeptidase/acylaminoacyl peptidase